MKGYTFLNIPKTGLFWKYGKFYDGAGNPIPFDGKMRTWRTQTDAMNWLDTGEFAPASRYVLVELTED